MDVRIPGRKSETVTGRIVRLPEADAKDVPSALANRGGGPLPVKPTQRPERQRPAESAIPGDGGAADPG